MGRGTAIKIETAASALASAAFGAALAFAAYFGLEGLEPAFRAIMASGGAVAGLLASWVLLSRVGHAPRFHVPVFDLHAVHVARPAVAPDVLDLTEIYEEPLELDDVLEQIGPGARVVRLFDPAAMPTPGELRDRIDRHLERGPSPVVVPIDESQALIEALNELRQSLR